MGGAAHDSRGPGSRVERCMMLSSAALGARHGQGTGTGTSMDDAAQRTGDVVGPGMD